MADTPVIQTVKVKIQDTLANRYTPSKYPSGHVGIEPIDVFWAYDEIIKSRIDKYEPGKPTDDIAGFLAFKQGDKRMKIKTGRFLTKKLGLGDILPEDIIHNISDEINSTLFSKLQISLDSGSRITDNYRNKVGGSSCMAGNCCEYTKLYENNPDRFQQLIVRFISDSGRAIVSKLDNGQFYMDNIYCSSVYIKEKMQEYADEQGWIWMSDGVNSLRFKGDSFTNYRDLVMSGLTYKEGEVPYMDTFYKYKIVGGKLNIYHDNFSGGCDGTTDGQEGCLQGDTYCIACEEVVSNNNNVLFVNGEAYCVDCYDNTFTHCSHCSRETVTDDITKVNDKLVCPNCLSRIYTECNDCNEYTDTDEILFVGDEPICPECVNDYSQCNDCNEYVDETTDIGDKGVCDDCLEQYLMCEVCDEYFTVHQVIKTKDDYKCIDCAGLGDCKGQAKFDFDGGTITPVEEPMTVGIMKIN